VKNEAEIIDHLTQLHNSENPTNWVLLGYQNNEIVLTGSGSGGLQEFKTKLIDNQIQYGALELIVKGDEYNPIKFVLLTWIGPKVGPGLDKARASAHRDDIFDLVKKGMAISAQHQVESQNEVNYEQLAQAVSRHRPTYGTATEATEKRQGMSRSNAKKGALSAFSVSDPAACEIGLKSVMDGQADWAILAYVKGKKDEVEMVTTGKGGIDGLKPHFPKDRIFYALLAMSFKTVMGDSIKKYVLVTMIGPEVPPLQKARSSAQRKDISDFVLSIVPLNVHYQPNDTSEMAESILIKMFGDQ